MDTRFLVTKFSRRLCLQKGSALIGLAACMSTGARALARPPDRASADIIVIDSALPGAADWAGDAASRGRVEVLSDDLAALFCGRLVPAWRRGGVRGLAGLTRAPALFLLEPLASEYGLRTVALERAPSHRGVFDELCQRPQRHPSVVSAEPVRSALLAGDEAAFAWRMAPLGRSLHADSIVIRA